MARDRIRAVRGHERVGDGRATTWSVAIEAYRAHYARRSNVYVLRPVVPTDEDAAEAAIAAAGLRMTKRAS
ncbi:MAG: hypothetical protein KF782_10445 [Labilithrix sp.]|nr:hypothetical protein [Labilithrix sp.]